MNIAINTQQTNFKGGFMIKSPASRGFNKALKTELIEALGSNKIIIDNYNDKHNQMFCIVKSFDKDRIFADFLGKHTDVKFEYYPDITTKLRFDSNNPKRLINYIQTNNLQVINDYEQMVKFLDSLPKTPAEKFAKINEGEENIIFESLQTNRNYITLVSKRRGAKEYTDSKKNLTIIISPKDKNKLRYVKVIPNISTPDSSSKFYAFSFDGDTKGYMEYKTFEQIKRFKELFAGACKK